MKILDGEIGENVSIKNNNKEFGKLLIKEKISVRTYKYKDKDFDFEKFINVVMQILRLLNLTG